MRSGREILQVTCTLVQTSSSVEVCGEWQRTFRSDTRDHHYIYSMIDIILQLQWPLHDSVAA